MHNHSSHSNSPNQQLFRIVPIKEPDYDNRPRHGFDCGCQMCQLYDHKMLKRTIQDQERQTNNKVKKRLIKAPDSQFSFYNWIVKRMLIPSNKIANQSIDLFIPEIIFYKDGEACEFFYNKELEDAHIKRISKDKLNNTFIQKIINERRRRYRDLIKLRQGRKKILIKKNLFGKKEEKKQSKDAVIIRYNDGYEQLASQNQFLALLLRRKQDSIWKQISYIRNFISIPPSQTERIIMVKYQNSNIKYPQLQERVRNLMKVYGQNMLPDEKEYITDSQENTFCRELGEQSKTKFAQYLLYKIVGFIQTFYDEKIILVAAGFLVTELDHWFLTDVYKLETKQSIKFDWTQQTLDRKINEQEEKIFLQRPGLQNPQCEENSKLIEEQMRNNYERMKDYCGLVAVEEDTSQQVQNNKFFQKLYPDFKQEITSVLQNPDLTIASFRTKYLGYKQQKKPIIKEFTSTMIKTIHYMSPRFHRAQPHDYIQFSPQKLPSLISGRSDSVKQDTTSKKGHLPVLSRLSRTIHIN